MNSIVFCPNCCSELFRNPKRGEHIWECPSCEGAWFIILTLVPRLPAVSSTEPPAPEVTEREPKDG